MRKASIAFLLLINTAMLALAQDAKIKKSRLVEKGFIVGIGHGIDTLNLPEGNYIPAFFIGHFGFSLSKRPKSNKGHFSLFLEPQVNPVFIRKGESTKKEIECGINVGFQHMYQLKKGIYSYILISTGPHFISVNTTRQVKGFIFSDNFGAGFYFNINETLCLNAGFRLRHLSNAQLKFPNQGINTFNYHLGLSKVIW